MNHRVVLVLLTAGSLLASTHRLQLWLEDGQTPHMELAALQRIEFAAGTTLEAPVVQISLQPAGSVRLDWEPVAGATRYDVYQVAALGENPVLHSSTFETHVVLPVAGQAVQLLTVVATNEAGN